MIRTVLPALAQAVVMNPCPTLCQDGTEENLKEKLQVYSATVCFCLCRVYEYLLFPSCLFLLVDMLVSRPSNYFTCHF